MHVTILPQKRKCTRTASVKIGAKFWYYFLTCQVIAGTLQTNTFAFVFILAWASSKGKLYANIPALLSQHAPERTDIRGNFDCNLPPATWAPAKNTEGSFSTWYSQITASVIDEDSKHRLIHRKWNKATLSPALTAPQTWWTYKRKRIMLYLTLRNLWCTAEVTAVSGNGLLINGGYLTEERHRELCCKLIG